MITLYTYATPNGRKISIMLEELGVPYEVTIVNIGKGEQFAPEFLKISPNNKIPAIVDHDAVGGPLTVFESGAILTYLAEKYGKFISSECHERFKTLEWLNWQVGGLGPMFGQLGYFGIFADEKIPQAIERFTKESERLLGVMEKRLSETPYLAGDKYSIADIAAYPWVFNAGTFLGLFLAQSMASKPAVRRWLKVIGERPAVKRGMAVPTIPS